MRALRQRGWGGGDEDAMATATGATASAAATTTAATVTAAEVRDLRMERRASDEQSRCRAAMSTGLTSLAGARRHPCLGMPAFYFSLGLFICLYVFLFSSLSRTRF